MEINLKKLVTDSKSTLKYKYLKLSSTSIFCSLKILAKAF